LPVGLISEDVAAVYRQAMHSMQSPSTTTRSNKGFRTMAASC
jgi:hypothetical protein